MLLSINEITFEFGARTLLQNASWHIFPNERIGLIGPNGAGKSTLLKILIGEYSVNKGSVIKNKATHIGYFHQDLQSQETEETILQIAMSAYEKAHEIEKEINNLQVQIEKENSEELIHQLTDKYHEFEIAGGYEMEYKSAEILEGLGFTTADLQRPFKTFSGGWRMRVILAKMILQQPEILLLDEPTNHLDLPSIEWMERYLSNYQGTVIIVSHDRYFLDKMVTKIVEFSQQTLHHYGGNYSFYEQEKNIRSEFQQREYENQQEFIKQQERFIDRFKAKASKATQAQSIVKKLDRLERIEAPTQENAQIKFKFSVATQPGKIISTFNHVSKKYPNIPILENASAEIVRGAKIGLIGANGKGKSTLLRLLAHTENADAGNCVLGHNVDISFYAQHQLEALTLENDILTELKENSGGRTELELRELLGSFLFRGDDVFKKIKILSGGEKARVALAKTIIQKANFLLLDEPTNHLDMSSVNMLIDALSKYEGTYIIVSHDRYFIQKTATHIWEIEDQKIKDFNGTFDEWEENKKKKILEQKKITIEPISTPKVKNIQPVHNEKSKEQKKTEQKFKKIELELEQKHILKSELESKLSNHEIYADQKIFQQIETQYNLVNSEIEQLQNNYELLFEQLLSYEK